MSTLLMRFAAPMQSWGTDKFERRGTETAPTKSGVIGLLAAALGRKRNECGDMNDLNSLRYGVRVERKGELLRDYQTAKSETSSYVTTRYYLSDAVFLIGLEGDDELLRQLSEALQSPVFPLFFGRRSCPPEGRVFLKIIRDKDLCDILLNEPSIITERRNENGVGGRRIVVDADDGAADYFSRDVPVSFDQSHRKYGFRRVSELQREVTEHDPMLELDE